MFISIANKIAGNIRAEYQFIRPYHGFSGFKMLYRCWIRINFGFLIMRKRGNIKINVVRGKLAQRRFQKPAARSSPRLVNPAIYWAMCACASIIFTFEPSFFSVWARGARDTSPQTIPIQIQHFRGLLKRAFLSRRYKADSAPRPAYM